MLPFPFFQLLNRMADFSQNLETLGPGGHPNRVLLSFLQDEPMSLQGGNEITEL
jgi:hypothetical protein